MKELENGGPKTITRTPEMSPIVVAWLRDFGRAIKYRRTQMRFNLREMAARANVTAAYISRIELGQVTYPELFPLLSIARAAGISEEEMIRNLTPVVEIWQRTRAIQQAAEPNPEPQPGM